MRREVARPYEAQALPLLAVLPPRLKLAGLEPGQGIRERLGEVDPHRDAYEVGQLWRGPGGFERVTVKRRKRLLELVEDHAGGGLDRDALRIECAATVGGAEGMMGDLLSMELRPHEDVAQHV